MHRTSHIFLIAGTLTVTKFDASSSSSSSSRLTYWCLCSIVFETPWGRRLGAETYRSFYNLYIVCRPANEHLLVYIRWAKSRYTLYSIQYIVYCIPIFGPPCMIDCKNNARNKYQISHVLFNEIVSNTYVRISKEMADRSLFRALFRYSPQEYESKRKILLWTSDSTAEK